MKNQDYSVTIQVDKSPKVAFNCINRVSEWWTENLEGSSSNLHDEFTVTFGEVHVSTQKIVELIPDQKVVWLVTYSNLNFIKDKSEWTGTKISFEVSEADGKTHVRFTHRGLVPEVECYDACSNAWGPYIQQSLFNLINKEQGMPTKAE
jgi:hypothetical protein